MGASARSDHEVAFGPFRFDRDNGLLFEEGVEVSLPPRAVRVLRYLLDRPGELASKEELLENCWDDVYVADESLTHTVSLLRQLLGDDPREPVYIQTFPRRGYRFIAEVEGSEAAGDPAPSRRSAATVAIAVVAVVIAFGSGIWMSLDGGPTDVPGSSSPADPSEPPATVPTGERVAASVVEPSLDTGVSRVLVLPFDNLGAAEETYFVEGIHEELLGQLARIRELRVISRTTAMHYGGADKTVPEIAGELDLDYLVEGSVLRSNGRVRISAQLIDGTTDEHLWGSSYDRALGDTLRILSDIARIIAGEIQVALTPEHELLLAAGAVDPAAQEAYLRGRHALGNLSHQDTERALELFREAIELDPEDARPHAATALTYVLQGLFGIRPRAEAVPRARAAAGRSLELDDRLHEAHTALGWIRLYFDWDWPAAERSFRLALALDPCDAVARHGIADYLTMMGKTAEAVRHVQVGRQCDPLSPIAIVPVVGHLYFDRRFDAVIRECRAALESTPGHSGARAFLAAALWEQGRHEEALEQYRDIWIGRNPDIMASMEDTWRRSTPREALHRLAEALQIEAASGETDALTVASLFARAGDVDGTMHWLDVAFRRRSPALIRIPAAPEYDLVRNEPRYRDLLDKIGLSSG